MLTTLYYYDYYKPYILDKNSTSSKNFISKKEALMKKSYFMNKSLNDNVKAYIFEMSSSFNNLKNISNHLTEKLETRFMTEPIKEDIENNIENFTKMYNNFIGFLEENSENSYKFKNISSNIKKFSASNKKILNKMGININSNGFLYVKENNDLKNIQKDKEILKTFYSKIYNNLCKFMQEPMSKHMEFKDFSFYFNYSNNFNKNSSFKLIEQGVLIDIGI